MRDFRGVVFRRGFEWGQYLPGVVLPQVLCAWHAR
jgi:hypothetical protein